MRRTRARRGHTAAERRSCRRSRGGRHHSRGARDRAQRGRGDRARRSDRRHRVARGGAAVEQRWPRAERGGVDDVVIFGAGRIGCAVGRLLLRSRAIHVRLIEVDRTGPVRWPICLPDARVLTATGSRPRLPRPGANQRDRSGRVRHAGRRQEPVRRDVREAPRRALHDRVVARERVRRGIRARRRSKSRRPSLAHGGGDRSLRPRPRTQQVAMLEGDRYESSTSSVRAESHLVGKPFRELPMTGSLIGAIVRDGTAIFPHGDDVLQPGRPRDRFHRFVSRRRRRARFVHAGVRPALGSPSPDTVGRRRLCAAESGRRLLKYLSHAALVPTAVAVVYSEPPGPSGRRGDHGRGRVEPANGSRAAESTWARAKDSSSSPRPGSSRPRAGALPYLLSGEDQLSQPGRRVLRGDVRLHDDGGHARDGRRGLSHSFVMWRQFTQWLGGMGIIVLFLAVLPRLRVGGRQLFESELPGPEIRAARRFDPRHGAAAVAALRRPHGHPGRSSRRVGLDSDRRAMDALRRGRTRVRDHADRRVLDAGAVGTRSSRAASQWVIAFFMVAGRRELRPHLPRAAAEASRRLLVRDEEFRLYVAPLTLGSLLLAVELLARRPLRG